MQGLLSVWRTCTLDDGYVLPMAQVRYGANVWLYACACEHTPPGFVSSRTLLCVYIPLRVPTHRGIFIFICGHEPRRRKYYAGLKLRHRFSALASLALSVQSNPLVRNFGLRGCFYFLYRHS